MQDEAIPLILGGGDVMVAAETGSGKTAAFSLPLLQIVHEDLRGRSSGSARSTAGGNRAGKGESGCRISRVDKDGQMVVSADGLSCQCEEAKWAGARGEVGVQGGVHCFEVSYGMVHAVVHVINCGLGEQTALYSRIFNLAVPPQNGLETKSKLIQSNKAVAVL